MLSGQRHIPLLLSPQVPFTLSLSTRDMLVLPYHLHGQEALRTSAGSTYPVGTALSSCYDPTLTVTTTCCSC